MFRSMRRFQQQLSAAECLEIIRQEKRGVLAVQGDGDYPYAVPLNYFYDEANGKLYFHGAKEGHKIDAIKRNPRVSFCVHDAGVKLDGDWAYTVRSVIVFGRMRLVEDPAETVAQVRKLGLKYYPDPKEVEAVVARAGARVQVLELTIEHMSGKRVHEK